eukprot:TRINITY_DN11764_c0_g1_i1.p2 TRINITY_DN11764_c0_g1~~TRINITY_DN11764_c0_g1_i1.p2  ORF type:complete len:169 (+),score=24.22 TRINITY_DN11764_c0_g1_i1:38-544(+)
MGADTSAFLAGLAAGVVCTGFFLSLRRKAKAAAKNQLTVPEPPPTEEVDTTVVLIVRKDLKMGTGKQCAQCCHAAVGVHRRVQRSPLRLWHDWYTMWEKQGAPKVTLRVDSQEALLRLAEQAKLSQLPHYLVTDAGRTQIAPGSRTVLAIGPAPSAVVHELTGDLPRL